MNKKRKPADNQRVPVVLLKFTGHADYKSMKPYIDIAEKAKTDAMDAMDKALGKN